MRGGTTREQAMTPECEHPARYPDEPPGMTGWWEWAQEKAETHKQKLCPHCKRWAIWEPRAAA